MVLVLSCNILFYLGTGQCQVHMYYLKCTSKTIGALVILNPITNRLCRTHNVNLKCLNIAQYMDPLPDSFHIALQELLTILSIGFSSFFSLQHLANSDFNCSHISLPEEGNDPTNKLAIIAHVRPVFSPLEAPEGLRPPATINKAMSPQMNFRCIIFWDPQQQILNIFQ